MSEAAPPTEPPAAPPPAPASFAAQLRMHPWTLLACVLFVAVGSQPGRSLYAWLAMLLLVLPWLLYTLVRAVIGRAQRKRRLQKIALWVLAVALVVGVQNYNEHAARREAEAVLARIDTYHARTGAWPATLEETGLDGAALRSRWRIIYRPSGGGAPRLSYIAPHMLFDVWEYDFATRSWKYEPY